MKPDRRTELLSLIEGRDGIITVDERYLVVSVEFAVEATNFLLELLDELQRRVEWKIQGRPGSPPT